MAGTVLRGSDFVRVVRELAERAGVDASPLDRPPRDRRADLLHDFFDLCCRELATEGGAAVRAYLEALPRKGRLAGGRPKLRPRLLLRT
jgi:hypothetical protein